jgi:hypothetical protein
MVYKVPAGSTRPIKNGPMTIREGKGIGWTYTKRQGAFALVVDEVGVDEAVVAAILWDKPNCDIEWCIRRMDDN